MPLFFRHTTIAVAIAIGVSTVHAAAPRAFLIESRNLAYDANYRNDQAGLRLAIDNLQRLTKEPAVAAYAHYYLSWSYAALWASQFQAKDPKGALESSTRAVEHARLGLALRDKDPEFHMLLTQALVSLMFADQSQFAKVYAEALATNRRAVELGPTNPRVVLMDAGMIFNNPSDPKGQDKGIARFLEALRLLDAEANATTADPILPRWGSATGHMALAGIYMRATPPRREDALAAADTALRMRPDFWYVREILLPQLRK